MKVIKEGRIVISGGEIIIQDWEVKDGTAQELKRHALKQVPIWKILFYRFLHVNLSVRSDLDGRRNRV